MRPRDRCMGIQIHIYAVQFISMATREDTTKCHLLPCYSVQLNFSDETIGSWRKVQSQTVTM